MFKPLKMALKLQKCLETRKISHAVEIFLHRELSRLNALYILLMFRQSVPNPGLILHDSQTLNSSHFSVFQELMMMM